ncbi:MAG: SMP-30/gluconolactonase/LRE family protein [Paludibacter sp.]|nr:SMP-30/gluconolactonase/LRE family protein [Paludibacter sp.]
MKTINFLKTIALFLFFNPVTLSADIFDNLQPVQIVTGLQFPEGPVWHPAGYLVFSDVTGNIIYKWSDATGLQTLANPSGNANGIIATKLNEFVVCRQGTRDVAKMDTLGNFTSIMSTWNGQKLNAPNDVALSYLGSIYFTDPDFGAPNRELTFQGLYCIPYNSTTPVLLDSTLIKPNGLTFVQDWRTLYVNESSTNTIYTYALKNESAVDLAKDKKVFLKVAGTGEIDGITADVFGNLFVAFGDGGVKIYDKTATLVGSITLPAGERVRNLCFGGKYNNLLFITAGVSVYKVEIPYFGDFIATGILSVPSDNSIIFNALSEKDMSAYISYGTNASNLALQTPITNFAANQPINITLTGLSGNTKYYYQLYYHLSGETNFKNATSGSFMTQRNQGQTFSFAVEADPHLDENSNYYTFRNTLQNELKLNPDFLIDLGDNFMSEKLPLVNYNNIERRTLLYRNFWDNVCNSMPLYLVVGNHEGELGWLNSNQPTDEYNITTALRKKYYPGPQPDGFYTGNETNDLIQGQIQNYYAWNWGDALFVVIDPYAYTTPKPSDAWGFTLGKTQYDWFRSTLENSKAKYKFVFSHQLVGGDKEGRGGSERVNLAEMGGQNADSTYGFDTQRPGWGKPIHQIMVENGVQIFFHGHDHLYVEQPKDGIVYMEVPQPSLPQYTNTTTAAGYGYVTGTILPCSGHINVTVTNDSAKVDYIGGYHVDNVSLGQINGNIRRSFSVKPKVMSAINSPEGNSKILEVYQSGQSIFLKSSSESVVYPKIYSLTGEEIFSFGKISLTTKTSVLQLPENLVSGVYILSINMKSGVNSMKIII